MIRTGLAALAAFAFALGTSSAPGAATGAALPAPVPGAEVHLRPDDGTFNVTGGGFGHGIGMSQYGADGAAKAGLDHPAILSHYYPGARLVSRAVQQVNVGVTADSDGVVEIAHRSGLRIAAGPAGAPLTLPGTFDRWRVRLASPARSSCVVEGREDGAWVSAASLGVTGCPATFSSSEGTVDLVLPSGEVRVYRGLMTAVRHGTGVLPVNRLDREQYLRSVVSSEMPSWFAPAAHRAQAVAARTYVARSALNPSYDICDTTSCQVYRGLGKRAPTGAVTSFELGRAVEATRGTRDQVLVDNAGRLATTMYSSSNGGWIAGRAGHHYLVSKADPYDKVDHNRRHAWTADLSVTSLERAFGLTRFERLQVTRRDGGGRWGGRVVEVLVEGKDGAGRFRSVRATGAELRRAYEFPHHARGLSSAYLSIAREPADSPPPVGGAAVRLAGTDRYGTAATVSARWSSRVEVVYLASGTEFPDALVAAARSGVTRGPVLITRANRLPAPVRAELQRLRPRRAVVLGGPERVSAAVLAEVKALTTTKSVQRIAGANRYDTAGQVASYYTRSPATIYVANGERFPDALAIAALANSQKRPLLLTQQGTLPSATRKAIEGLRPRRVVVVGGDASISDAVVAALRPLTSTGTVERWAGPDRYATAAAIARRSPVSQGAWVAAGVSFPDALVGAARAGQEGQPLLLTRTRSVPAPVEEVITARQVTRLTVLGGTGAVSGATFDRLRSLLR